MLWNAQNGFKSLRNRRGKNRYFLFDLKAIIFNMRLACRVKEKKGEEWNENYV